MGGELGGMEGGTNQGRHPFNITTIHFLSGADGHEEEKGCVTEKTTPSSLGPGDQSHTNTRVEPDVSDAEEDISHVDEDTSPPEEETAGPSGSEEASRTEPSDEREEPEGDSGPSGSGSSQSVDELMADWQEDLEAFQQMDKDEL